MTNYIEKKFKYVYVPPVTESYVVNEYICHDKCTTTYDVVYTPGAYIGPPDNPLDPFSSGESEYLPGSSIIYATTTCVKVCEWKQVTKYYTIPGYYTVVNDIGWTAGAHSLLVLNHEDGFYFQPRADAIGIVTGITTSAHNVGYSYQDIDFGFYISKGLYRIMESSVFKTEWNIFNQDDIFAVLYYEDRIVYTINDSVVYATYVEITDPLIGDISLYASGDRVDNACIYAAYIMGATVNASSTVTASMNVNGKRSLSATINGSASVSGSPDFKRGLISTIQGSASIGASLNINNLKTCTCTVNGSSTITAYLEGKSVNVSVEFSELSTMSSSGLGNYAESIGIMAPLESLSESGLLAPSLSIANTTMLGLATGMNVLNIEPISMTIDLIPLDSISSEGPYAESETSFENMGSFGGEFPVYDGLFLGDVPSIEMYSTGTVDVPNGLSGDVPSFTLESYTGAQLYADLPTLSLTIEGEVTNVGRTDSIVPGMLLSAYAYTGYNARAFLEAPKFTIDFTAGAVLKENIPKFSISGEALIGSVINSEIIVPRINITTDVNIEDYGTAELEVPGFLSLSGILNSSFGRFKLLATGFTTLDVTLNTQVMNINNNALTEYNNFEFDNILQIGDIYYGVKSDGLYLLNNDTDDTVNISASFETMPSDFGNIQLKNMSYSYVTARTDSLFTMQSAYDEQYSTIYNSANMYRSTPYNWRVQLGRGLKAIYWGTKVSNVNGSDFQIQSINNHINVLRRRR